MRLPNARPHQADATATDTKSGTGAIESARARAAGMAGGESIARTATAEMSEIADAAGVEIADAAGAAPGIASPAGLSA